MHLRYIENHITVVGPVIIKQVSGVKLTHTRINACTFLEYDGITYGYIKHNEPAVIVNYACGLSITVTNRVIRLHKNSIIIDKYIIGSRHKLPLNDVVKKNLDMIRNSFRGFVLI